MKNPLIINIRCSCIEEYLSIQRLHKEYTRQLRTGEIMSVFVGAELAVPGEYAVVDKLMEKGGQCRKPPVAAFYPKEKAPLAFDNSLSQEQQIALKEEITRSAVVVNGPMPEEEIALPQAVDGGVDAAGNVPLPEKPLTLDEMAAIGAGYAEQEEELVGCEEPVPDQMWKEGKEDYSFRPEPAQGVPAVETEVHKSFRHVPETLTAVGTEPFSTFGPQEFNQAAPSVAEESDDGDEQDYNTTYAG